MYSKNILNADFFKDKYKNMYCACICETKCMKQKSSDVNLLQNVLERNQRMPWKGMFLNGGYFMLYTYQIQSDRSISISES